MAARKVIAYKYLPLQWPITYTGMWYLLLDKWHAPGWVWGVLGTVLAVVWIVVGYDIFTRSTGEVILK